jgi:tetratricopeptide (TPR) repeat protein
MSSIFYSKKLSYLNREYLFQTTYNELDRSVVCSLFNEGRLLNIHFTSLPGDLRDKELVDFMVKVHEQRFNDYEILLRVTENNKDTDRAEIIIKLGSALLANQLYDEAIELLKSASARHDNNSALKLLLGKVYIAKNMFGDAESELNKAVELSPMYPDYRNLLGETYLNLGKPLAAINQFRKAVELNVYYDRAFYNLGLGYILNGIIKEDFDLAKDLQKNSEESFGKAIAFNPGYADQNYRTGMELLEQDRLEEAYEKLAVVSRSDNPDSSSMRLLNIYIKFVYGDNGNTEKNIKDYIREIENLLISNPGYADLENELGMGYTVMGKIMRDKAINHFKKALEINPGFKKAAKNIKLSEYDLKGFEALLEAILK